jgi:hypothetical protein
MLVIFCRLAMDHPKAWPMNAKGLKLATAREALESPFAPSGPFTARVDWHRSCLR